MKEKIKCIILSLLMILTIYNCENEQKKDEVKEVINQEVSISNNLNISILLDLSDRIDPKKYPNTAMDYYQRDVEYIKSISEAFDSHLRQKKVREMDDKIQVFFDPEPSNISINSISNSLKYKVDRKSASIAVLDEIKEVYSSKPKEIYELAINDDKYVGSDTWRFLKTKVDDYCIDDNYRNILIILTDGYIYHKDGIITDNKQTTYITPQFLRGNNLNTKLWEDKMNEEDYGFIIANENLSDLEILVLGINPDKSNPFGEYIIKKYWADWFNIMQVKRYDIKTADLPSNMDKIIKDFIVNKHAK